MVWICEGRLLHAEVERERKECLIERGTKKKPLWQCEKGQIQVKTVKGVHYMGQY